MFYNLQSNSYPSYKISTYFELFELQCTYSPYPRLIRYLYVKYVCCPLLYYHSIIGINCEMLVSKNKSKKIFHFYVPFKYVP